MSHPGSARHRSVTSLRSLRAVEPAVEQAAEPASPVSGSSSIAALFLRLGWLVLGPAALFVLVALMAFRPTGWEVDLAYLGALFAVLLARYIDVARFGGTTADGEPATWRHVRRHAAGLSAVAVAAWSLVRLAPMLAAG